MNGSANALSQLVESVSGLAIPSTLSSKSKEKPVSNLEQDSSDIQHQKDTSLSKIEFRKAGPRTPTNSNKLASSRDTEKDESELEPFLSISMLEPQVSLSKLVPQDRGSQSSSYARPKSNSPNHSFSFIESQAIAHDLLTVQLLIIFRKFKLNY